MLPDITEVIEDDPLYGKVFRAQYMQNGRLMEYSAIVVDDRDIPVHRINALAAIADEYEP